MDGTSEEPGECATETGHTDMLDAFHVFLLQVFNDGGGTHLDAIRLACGFLVEASDATFQFRLHVIGLVVLLHLLLFSF